MALAVVDMLLTAGQQSCPCHNNIQETSRLLSRSADHELGWVEGAGSQVVLRAVG